MKNKVTYFLAIAISLIWLSSCGVRRNNIISRKFHSTTSVFNYLYNGEVVYKEGVSQINAAYRIPPEGYVPVWYAGSEADSKAYGSNFESAIEKAEVALQKHNQKDNKWFDELRFLIGRSWFYKRNYVLALKNFEYVIKTWPDSKIVPDVYLWIVKTHYMDGNGTLAIKVLEEKVSKLSLNKRQLGVLALVRAQVFLDEGNHEEVLRTLNSSKKLIRGGTNKARASYLLGQIYQDKQSLSRSYENYKAVTRLNTDYELIFNAKLNMAKLLIAGQNGSADNEKLRRMLKRMLRDEKNIDYRDRVYYELAMLDIKSGDRMAAIENLKKSVAVNTDNVRQKALSYYKVGQIYFYDLKDFPHAQVYFDSASAAITRDAPEYREISMISATLKEYVGFTNAIHLNDSLLRLSRMSDSELEKYVDKVIEEKRKREAAEEAAKLEELNRLNDPNLFAQQEGPKTGRSAGFYFDSPELVNSGRVEFEQKWGMRKLEDNWRRKNKAIEVGEDQVAAGPELEISKEDLEKYGSKEKAGMIKMVPRNEEDIAVINQKIVEAMYGLGQVYGTKLLIIDSALAVYSRLVSRYPDSEYSLKARYAMFQIHKGKGEIASAEAQTSIICGQAPKSRYCKYCKGEAFEAESSQGFEDFASAYKALLETFQTKDYSTCIDFSNFIASSFPAAEGLAEVMMIRGKCFGYLGQRDSLRSIYSSIRNNFPDADVVPEVVRTLQLMDGGKTSDAPSQPSDKPAISEEDPRFAGFTEELKPNEKLFVVMLVKKEKLTNSDLQIKVNDLNSKYFLESRLNVSIFLYKDYHLPYVSQFDSYKDALSYIRSVIQEPALADLLTNPEEKVMIISPANFRVAYGKKRMEDYTAYYENVLLKRIDGK